MASAKFHRKIREVADKVMEEGEEFVSGVAGQAGAGYSAKAGMGLGGTFGEGAQVVRAGATLAGKMFQALVILTDRNVYVIKTPMLKAYEVKEVALKGARSEVPIERVGSTRIRVGDYMVVYTIRMSSQASDFLDAATDGGAEAGVTEADRGAAPS